MSETDKPVAGSSFPWDYLAGAFLRVESFVAMAQLAGDRVVSQGMGPYALVGAELPNPDVTVEQRSILLPIVHKSDFKSFFCAHLDSGVEDCSKELVAVYEPRRGLLGAFKARFHLACFPDGTWDEFFEAVEAHRAADFRRPPPLSLWQPSSTVVFGPARNLFRA